MSTGTEPLPTVRSLARRSGWAFLAIVIVAALPAFMEGFDGNLFNFGAPFIVHHIHASASLLGTLATGMAIGIALFSLVGGYLFDHFSVKYTIMLSVAIFAVFTVLTGLATSPTMLFIFRMMVGVGIGMFQPAIIALLGDILFETRGRAVSAFAVFFGGGNFVGPYVIQPFLPHFKTPFIISGIVSLLVLILFYVVIPKTYKAQTRAPRKFRGIFNRNVSILSFSIFFFGIALFAFHGYGSLYLLKGLSLPSARAATILSMAGLGGLICAFPIGYLADRFGRKYIVSLAALLISLGAVGLFLVSRSEAPLIVLTFAFGAGWGIYVDLVSTLGQDSVSDLLAGTVTGWLLLVFNVGAMLGGPLFGALLPNGFVTAGLLSMGGAAVISFILTLFTRPIKESNIILEGADLASAPASGG